MFPDFGRERPVLIFCTDADETGTHSYGGRGQGETPAQARVEWDRSLPAYILTMGYM